MSGKSFEEMIWGADAIKAAGAISEMISFGGESNNDFNKSAGHEGLSQQSHEASLNR